MSARTIRIARTVSSSQIAWASGATSPASAASTATEPWRPTPLSARPPAIRFARSWSSHQVNRTGSATVPAVRWRGDDAAVASISRVKMLIGSPVHDGRIEPLHHEVDEIADAVNVRQHIGDGDVLQLGIFRPQPINEANLQ